MDKKLNPSKTKCEPKQVIPAVEEIPCAWPKCHRIFVSLENLEKHLKAHTEGLHECLYCNRQFQCQSKLKCHVRIHTGEKPFACSLCGKSFSTKNQLQSHTRKHTGEKPFKCTICQKSFSHKATMQTHIRIHTGEKPYSCEMCEKSFAQLTSLVFHQRMHSGDKPYKCKTCSKSFSQQSNYNVHMRTHTGERPFNCQLCQRSFAQQNNLKYHMRKHSDKLPRANSIRSKCDISDRNHHIGKVIEKREKQNKTNSCKQQTKLVHKEDAGRHNKRVSMVGATTSRMKTKYEKNKHLSSLTCQVCHHVLPSLQTMCRHYSLEHKLPKVVMENLVNQEDL